MFFACQRTFFLVAVAKCSFIWELLSIVGYEYIKSWRGVCIKCGLDLLCMLSVLRQLMLSNGTVSAVELTWLEYIMSYDNWPYFQFSLMSFGVRIKHWNPADLSPTHIFKILVDCLRFFYLPVKTVIIPIGKSSPYSLQLTPHPL